MLRKYLFSCCLVCSLAITPLYAEEFSPYHPGAFSGFWINKPVMNIKELVKTKQGRVNNKLWSDDYWAVYAGGLAYRYAAPGFWINPKKPKPKDWMIPSDYILKKRPASQLIKEGKAHLLSPAEKYDLLVGDTGKPKQSKVSGYTLTRAFLSQITAKTQPWEGSCDGWAFASINEKAPVKTVKVKNLAGQEITFYPSDIRALLTLLYSDYKVASFGRNCFEDKPALDGTGRVRSKDCRDTNPGLFHVLLVNQIGIGGRGFVMDTDYSRETWNYPIKSYSMQYYNPQTNQAYQNPLHAAISKEKYTRDRFASHRGSNVTSIIGVNVALEYQIEAYPTLAKTLTAEHDRSFKNAYRYDLELDIDGEVIGGEWDLVSQQNHPDLVSFVAPNYINKSRYDQQVRGNNITEILRSIRPYYIKEASANRRPLFNVVRALAAMSQ